MFIFVIGMIKNSDAIDNLLSSLSLSKENSLSLRDWSLVNIIVIIMPIIPANAPTNDPI